MMTGKNVKVSDLVQKLFTPYGVSDEIDKLYYGFHNCSDKIAANEGKAYAEAVLEAVRKLKEAKDQLVDIIEGVLPDSEEEWD